MEPIVARHCITPGRGNRKGPCSVAPARRHTRILRKRFPRVPTLQEEIKVEAPTGTRHCTTPGQGNRKGPGSLAVRQPGAAPESSR